MLNEYAYALQNRPLTPGSYPDGDGFIRSKNHPNWLDRKRYYADVFYSKPLPCDIVEKYELEYDPMAQLKSDTQWLQYPDFPGNDVIGERTEIFTQVFATVFMLKYYFPEENMLTATIGGVTFRFPRAAVRHVFQYLPDWTRACCMLMFQNVDWQTTFLGLTTADAMDKAASLVDSGRYSMIDDCFPED